MEREVKIYFDQPSLFEPNNLKPLNGVIGLYFIFSQSIFVQYPFDKSRLLYIGMSERRTNSIGVRLLGHYDGRSKNVGITNYRKIETLLFTYINFEVLKSIWNLRIEDLESYFILDFVKNFGVYPICNNKTGFEVLNTQVSTNFEIDWKFFK